MSDVHEDALRSLQILRRNLRAMKVERGGSAISLDAAYGDVLDDLGVVVEHHRILSERVPA